MSDELHTFDKAATEAVGRWCYDDMGRRMPIDRPPDREHDTFLIREYRSVMFEFSGSKYHLMWDVARAEEAALLAAVSRLGNSPSSRSVRLEYFFYGWIVEELPTPIAAVERIAAIQAHRDVPIAQPTVLSTRTIDEAFDATNLISFSLREWDRSHGNLRSFDNDRFAGFAPYILIFRPSEDNQMVFSYIGNSSVAARAYGRSWVAEALNGPADSESNPETEEYSSQINRDLSRLVGGDTPVFQHVRTLVEPERGLDPYWLYFERLIAPFRLHDGSDGVVSIVSPSRNVECPLPCGP